MFSLLTGVAVLTTPRACVPPGTTKATIGGATLSKSPHKWWSNGRGAVFVCSGVRYKSEGEGVRQQLTVWHVGAVTERTHNMMNHDTHNI